MSSMETKKETRRHVKKSKNYEKKFEAAACKLEEQVTKEDDLPMWLRERLEEGKLEEAEKSNGNCITTTVMEFNTTYEPNLKHS